jgi:ribosomal protein S12 methylthiotransferase accessory factor
VNELTHLFRRAAAVLAGENGPDADEDVRRLLATLGYTSGDTAERQQHAALLAAAAQLRRIFQLRAPDAPGLVFFGGEADPSLIGWKGTGHAPGSLAGAGLSIREAFESCVGEGVEYLSQFDTQTDELDRASLDQRARSLGKRLETFVSILLETVGISPTQPIDWVRAKRLHDGAATWLPADICLRRSADRRDFATPFKLSTGCGAGASFERAALHGVCELIERDAVALWWRGGRRGRAVAFDGEAGHAAIQLLAALREGKAQRTTWLLDITTEIGVPCITAASTGPDGRGLACGFAARPTRPSAARAAIFELCKMELGSAVVEAKRSESGEDALNQADRAYLRRTSQIDATQCALLHPAGPPIVESASHVATLNTIIDHLGSMGIEIFAVDLQRPQLAVPAVRVVAPHLQLDPSEIVTPRLASAIADTGGGEAYTGGVALL